MKHGVRILTVSDSSYEGKRQDLGGPLLKELIENIEGFEVLGMEIVPDEKAAIKERLTVYSENPDTALILTTGGTGFASRDVTPEATLEVIDKRACGISEAMRAYGAKYTPMSYLSRGEAGIKNSSLIINFPGNPKAIRQGMEAAALFLKHGLDTLRNVKDADAIH